jgi:hypothetical protein
VATGIRRPRRQGTPPICRGFVVTRLNSIQLDSSQWERPNAGARRTGFWDSRTENQVRAADALTRLPRET